MIMKKKLFGLILTGALVTISLAGYGSTVTAAEGLTGEGLNEATTVTIGYTGTTSPNILADITYGILQADFGDEVTVKYQKFESGPDAITALVAGSTDIQLGVGDLPVVTAGSNGTEFKLISYTNSAPDTYISVDPDSGIESIAEISGLKVGVPLGTMSQYTLQQRLNEAGLSADDVEIINIAGLDLVTAFVAGEVDVMVNHYTLTNPLINSGEAKKIDEADPGVSWILANVEYSEENPEIIARVLAYYEDVYAYLDEKGEEAINEIAEAFDADAPTLQTARELNDTTLIHEITPEAYAELEAVLAFAIDNDIVTETYDVSSYVDTKYVLEAIRLISE